MLRRTYAAPRDRVFRALTVPAEMEKWMAPTEEMGCKVLHADVRVGGQYRLEMLEPGAKAPYVAVGTYQEVKAPERLAYTWDWEDGDHGHHMGVATLVTVELKEVAPGQTELTLTHERFPAPEATKGHAEGWQACLDRLAKAL